MASRIALTCRRLSTLRPQSHRSSTNNAAASTAAVAAAAAGEVKIKAAKNLEMVATCLPLGIVLIALTLGISTAKGQLSHSPSVRVNKKLRGMIPEIELPDHVADEGGRYVNSSFFRKVAHLQHFDAVRSGVSDPTRPDNAFQMPRHVESLKSSDVDYLSST